MVGLIGQLVGSFIAATSVLALYFTVTGKKGTTAFKLLYILLIGVSTPSILDPSKNLAGAAFGFGSGLGAVLYMEMKRIRQQKNVQEQA